MICFWLKLNIPWRQDRTMYFFYLGIYLPLVQCCYFRPMMIQMFNISIMYVVICVRKFGQREVTKRKGIAWTVEEKELIPKGQSRSWHTEKPNFQDGVSVLRVVGLGFYVSTVIIFLYSRNINH